MRKQPTDAEALLWRLLRRRQLGVRFRRQHQVGRYILDFYCVSARLAVELDGGGHAGGQQREYDERRDRALQARGIRVLRVWNTDVLRDTEAVLEMICSRLNSPPAI